MHIPFGETPSPLPRSHPRHLVTVCTMTRFLCGLFAFFSQTQERERNTLFALGINYPPPHTFTLFIIEVLCGGLGEDWVFILFLFFSPMKLINGLLTASTLDNETLYEADDFEKHCQVIRQCDLAV